MDKLKPTLESANFLQHAYDFFNEELFESRLPACMLVLQRESKSCYGYFSCHRWVKNKGEKIHEISLNPAHFATRKLQEVFQTLVHEQVHLEQFTFGTPSRTGYHNKQFAEYMKRVGLMPSSTGQPGGDQVGQHMGDYAIPDGIFLKSCNKLVKQGVVLKWFDRQAISIEELLSPDENSSNAQDQFESLSALFEQLETAIEEDQEIEINDSTIESLLDTAFIELVDKVDLNIKEPGTAKKRNKIKYSCPDCGTNVWGKPYLNISCGDCDTSFEEQN